MSGLREEIRRRMIVHNPRTVDRAMLLARGLEVELFGKVMDRGRSRSELGQGLEQRGPMNMNWANQAHSIGKDCHPSNPPSRLNARALGPGEEYPHRPHAPTNYGGGSRFYPGGNSGGTTRIQSPKNCDGRIVSHQEFLHRREKGLCFKCGEPYHPLHRCVNRSLRVTILAEEDGEEVEEGQGTTEEGIDQQQGEAEAWLGAPVTEYNTLELPMYSVRGINQPQTMKMKAKVAGREVVAMVDSGASHNFISRNLIADLGIKADEGVKFSVCLGDGCRVACQGLCKGVEVDLGLCQIQIEGYLFDLGELDLILGVDWLRTLGDVMLNWAKMEMRFTWQGQTVVLRGDPTLSRSVVSFKSIAKVREVQFQEGDMVYLKLRPHRQNSVCSRIAQKLSNRFYGPFKIEKKVGTVAYKLQLPEGSRVHPVFHVSCLKRAVGTSDVEIKLPEEIDTDLLMTFEPDVVLAERIKHLKGQPCQQILVRWKGRSEEEATWESLEDFQGQFPDYHLEDKAHFEEASNVMSPNSIMKDSSPSGPETSKGPTKIAFEKPKIVKTYAKRNKGEKHVNGGE
ncbi:uncharacterized protein LOC142550108 [Primulina tabacum]|uniref:uncharacterized protein LOC142550108 n=1 Tax=Primulina tabacum TaxID=48773 RepID=UPI003F5A4762